MLGRRNKLSKEVNNASRSEQRIKRKKTNLILNSLIIVVILLIVFVSWSIFRTNDENNAARQEKTTENQGQTASSDEEEETDQETDTDTDNANEESSDETDSENDGEEVVTEGGSDSNVVKTIENSSWQPVGTTQSGEHAASYSAGVDWDEQVKALAYGTGLDESNMIVWFLGNNNKDPQKSIGTVSSSDKSEKYRVYIEWVDAEGWKPTKVEEIKDLNIR